MALGKPLAGALAPWASLEQRGFLKERMMVDNVIELDTYGRLAALTANVGGLRNAKLPWLVMGILRLSGCFSKPCLDVFVDVYVIFWTAPCVHSCLQEGLQEQCALLTIHG